MTNFKAILNTIKKIISTRLLLTTVALPLLLLFLLATTIIVYNFYYWGKIYPGIVVAGVDVGGLTRNEAINKLENSIKIPENVTLTANNQGFEISTNLIELTYDFDSTTQKAFNLFKSSNNPNEIIKGMTSAREKPKLQLDYKLNQEKLDENLSLIAGETSSEPIYPEVNLVNGKIVVERGKPGSELDKNKLKKALFDNWKNADFSPVVIPITSIDPTLDDKEAVVIEERAQLLKDKSFSLTFEYNTFYYKGADIVSLIEKEGFSNKKVETLVTKLEKQVERPAQNAAFKFEDGRVQEFLPAKDGITLNKEGLVAMVYTKLSELENSDEKTATINIPTQNTPPNITTSEVNDLGITELIGRGESRFAGSIASRVHNIQLAASKFNGVLIEPGQTMSFNDIVGDVSALTGYQQAYIISGGRTVLGDGGGVCQVSSTMFRVALDAGLPIVERRAHSYRVAYYEQGSSPGLDATVYSPTTDLKIKNDTPGHILIQTFTDTKNAHLVFEMYGTSDGRVATVTKPVVTSVIAPPEDLYIDDPTLPEGTVKQIDWKAWGANVNFSYKVVRNGETIFEKQYLSNYRPWQAKFLRGVSPAI